MPACLPMTFPGFLIISLMTDIFWWGSHQLGPFIIKQIEAKSVAKRTEEKNRLMDPHLGVDRR